MLEHRKQQEEPMTRLHKSACCLSLAVNAKNFINHAQGVNLMRAPLIAANWKLHKSIHESVAYARELKGLVGSIKGREIALFPSFVALKPVSDELKETAIRVGAQDIFYEAEGAFTGEVSPLMIKGLCSFCIVGHSERRKYFGETDEIVNRKAIACIQNGITPIICVGESVRQKEEGRSDEVISSQVRAAISGISKSSSGSMVIAFEPLWAIGSGKYASPGEIEHAHSLIRSITEGALGREACKDIKIIYGGSVGPDNIQSLMRIGNVDGVLVGKAGLDPSSFARIAMYPE